MENKESGLFSLGIGVVRGSTFESVPLLIVMVSPGAQRYPVVPRDVVVYYII